MSLEDFAIVTSKEGRKTLGYLALNISHTKGACNFAIGFFVVVGFLLLGIPKCIVQRPHWQLYKGKLTE